LFIQKQKIYKLVILLVTLGLILPQIFITSFGTNEPQQQWIRAYDGGMTDKALAVTTDSNNNIIVTGFSRIIDDDSCYTIKYDPTGTKLFDIVTNFGDDSYGNDVAVDSQDNIIIAGTCVFGGSKNYLIAKYDSNKNHQWNIKEGTEVKEIAFGVAVDNDDNIIITGQYDNTSLVIYKYDKFGVKLWNKTLLNSDETCGKAIAIDDNNNIIVTGYRDTPSFREGIIIKYSSSGTEIWNQTYSNNDFVNANSVAIDSNNNIVVIGTVYDEADSDIFVIKYDENGVEQWIKSYSKSLNDLGSDVAIDLNDDITLIGTYYETHEKNNYLVIHYDSLGNFKWKKEFDRDYNVDYGTGVAIDSYGKTIITGFSTDSNNDYLTIKYGHKPIADFTYSPTQPCVFDSVQFTDTSIDPAGKLVDWYWTFGDGDASSDQNTSHQYSATGQYTVTLTVTDDDGETDDFSETITVVNAPPVADFTFKPSIPRANEQVNFTDLSVDYDGSIVSWFWDFDDGNTSTGQDPTHSYSDLGIYNVELTVTDNEGLTDSIIKALTVNNELPRISNVNADPNPQTFDKNVNISCEVYDNIMVDTVKAIVEYPDSSTQENICTGNGFYYHTEIYDQLGNYTYYIWANDTSGNINTSENYTFEIINNPPDQPTNPSPDNGSTNVDINPVLSVTVTDPDENSLHVSFFDASDDSPIEPFTFIPSGSTASVTWNGLAYDTTYSWYVIVNDSKTQTVSQTWNFKTKKEPKTDPPGGGETPFNPPFNPPEGPTNNNPVAKIIVSDIIEFVDTNITFDGSESYDPDGDGLTYKWNFYDEVTLNGKIIEYSFSKSGIYSITLTVSDGKGGKDSDSVNIEIITANYAPDDPVVTGPTKGKININYTFTAIAIDKNDDNISYNFDWNDSKTTKTDFIPNGTKTIQNHSWISSGKYIIKINATDNKTNSDTVEFTIFINVKEINFNGSTIGYLNDTDNDSVYNSFYYYLTNQENPVKFVEPHHYLIDLDNNSNWDLIHDDETNETTVYKADQSSGDQGNALLVLLPILFIIFLIILFLLLAFKKKSKDEDKTENPYPTQIPDTKPYSSPGEDMELNDVHSFVDSLSYDDSETTLKARIKGKSIDEIDFDNLE